MRPSLLAAALALVLAPLAMVAWLTIGGGHAAMPEALATLLVWLAPPAVLVGLLLLYRSTERTARRAWPLAGLTYVAVGVLYLLASRGNAFDSAPLLQVLLWPLLWPWWDLCHLIGAPCPAG